MLRIVGDMPDSDVRDDLAEYGYRLGVVLALARKAVTPKLRQEDAAARLGMAPDTISRWENGENKISAYDLSRLVRLYGFDPDLALNPPASKVEVKRRLGPVADAARQAVRQGLTKPTADEHG